MADIELMTLEDYRHVAARARPRDLEHQEQVKLFAWASDNVGRWPEMALLFAIPNGGLRNKATARRMRDEGVRAGVPDICLPVARGVYHGLFVEMKANGGRVRPVQLVWINALRSHGYAVAVSYSFEEARSLIVSYLDGGEL